MSVARLDRCYSNDVSQSLQTVLHHEQYTNRLLPSVYCL